MAAPLLAPAPSALIDGPLPKRVTRQHDAEKLLKRLEALRDKRRTFDTHWQLVADIVWPDWADFTTTREQGERRTQEQFDATAAYALERFAAILEMFLTPRASKWMGLRASVEGLNDEQGVTEWFDEVSRILHDRRAQPESNFYGAMQVAYKSHGAFGNAAVSIEPSHEGGIVYQSKHINGVYIAHDDQGRVSTVYESYQLTYQAAAKRFGKDALPEQMKAKLDQTPFERTEFVRCVFPREDYLPGRIDERGMRFVSIDIEPKSKEVLSEGGVYELPIVYSRYTLNPHEDYGRGPAMVCLADILTLQEMEKTHLRAGEMVAHPPLLLASDDVLGVGGTRIDLRSGALNYGGLDAAGNALVKPLLSGGRIDLTYEMMQQKRLNVRHAMLLDLFELLAENPQMTATQALLVAQERGMITAPVVGRLQQEMLGPIIHRELGLAWRMGSLPPVPGVLLEAQGDYRIEYTSPATRAQRSEELVGITRTLEISAPFINANPRLLEKFKAEKVIDLAAELTGVPAKLLRSDEEYAEVIAAQDQAAAEETALAAAPEMAKAAQSAAAAAKDVQQVPALARELGLA